MTAHTFCLNYLTKKQVLKNLMRNLKQAILICKYCQNSGGNENYAP